MPRILLRDVVRAVAEAEGLPVGALIGPGRTKTQSHARQRAMYLAHQVCPHASFPMIARAVGRKDHTVALYGVGMVRLRLTADAAETGRLLDACRLLGLEGLPTDRGGGLRSGRCAGSAAQ